jgi:hypothetical protein
LTKKELGTTSKKNKKLFKIASVFALLSCLAYFFFYLLPKQQKGQDHLLPLQADIQTLRAQIRQLESLIEEAKQQPAFPSSPYPREDLTKLIFWHQFTTDVWSGQPFQDALEKLLSTAPQELEKIPQIQLLLTQGAQGIPTIESLWLMVDTPQETTKPETLEEEHSFWLEPLKYIRSHLKWRKFFIIKTQANEKVRLKLKKLIAQRKFTKALNVLKESGLSYTALEETLHLMSDVHFALKIVEERIVLSLTSGEHNEK